MSSLAVILESLELVLFSLTPPPRTPPQLTLQFLFGLDIHMLIILTQVRIAEFLSGSRLLHSIACPVDLQADKIWTHNLPPKVAPPQCCLSHSST